MKRVGSPFSVILQTILLLGAIPLLPPGDGAPSVTIDSPADGFLSTSATVNVSGNASGSDDRWFQTSRADFTSGSLDQLTDTNGTLVLNRTRMPLYDDFNDNDLDSSLWDWSSSGDIAILETGSELLLNGTSGLCWSESYIMSTKAVPTAASADLNSLSGSDYELMFYLYQDSSNYIYFRIYSYYYANQSNQSQARVYWGYERSGSSNEWYLGSPPAGVCNFKIALTGNSTNVYLNNVNRGSTYMPQLSPYIRIEARCWDTTGWLDARWDNVRWGYLYSESGNLSSSIYDSSCVDPVLKAVRWNATVPNGTGLSVQVRSSGDPGMASPTAWTSVSNSQGAGLPALRRYLQYRAILASPDGLGTPSFRDIELAYNKPVAKVELSFDGNATWFPATGTGSWNVSLKLPENTNLLWVKVTDVAGDTQVTSIRVEVDTTPPAGSVVIDGNAPFTTDHGVSLALNASDRYGVVSMMASEDPGFEGIEWMDYTPALGFRLSDGDGTKAVFAKFKDSSGWESAMCNDSILLDTQAPLGSVLIDRGAEYTRNATVTLSFNASDPAGVSAMLVSNTLDFAGAQWMDYEQSLRWGLIAGSGPRSVYAKFRDAGGHASQPCDDSIIADLAAPAVSLSINGGTVFTRYQNITVGLTPAENYQAVAMQLREGEGSFPTDLAWAPYQPASGLVLSAGDGAKTVGARLMDAAGNIGPAAYATIVLDTAAPVTKLAGFPEVSYRAAINISWDGTDAQSGVLFCDIQYRTGDGPWTDWLQRTCSTSAVFTGEDSKTYSFRARAQDKAGNLEDFPATVDNTVTLRLSKGALTITNPAQKATLGGKARINGECQPDSEGREPVQVLVRLDDGPWQLAEGTQNWSIYLDTTALSDGSHVLRVRTFDGSQYSTETERTITVSNARTKAFDWTPVLAGALVVAVAAAAAMAVLLRRRPGAATPAASPPPR